ncbi:hypothetical protein N7462_003971 [Penicillium macrosclerotiorum]|uniref:uncharacterized protein n=1 Tax=Penicillium macrosclerotiorum TaxID=303699 RepID=UPI002548DA20|nr:uncharacterized protein N7462_003971 [Penicillium macrosclerotiorum]KAJ5689579.1 hypothetical protein N7462_003971 [Penicillium macrosclerotiorum]
MVDAVTIASNVTHQPTLYLSPLLSTTESRFFMYMFSTETATRLFPAAPKLFLQRMISGALERPHLFYALLAAACGHHSRLVQQDTNPRSKMIGLKYTTLAISHLRAALTDPDEMLEPETLTTAMALCTNDVCNGNMNIWSVHLDGVIRLLTAFLENQKATSKHDPFAQCLVKWCITMDVLAGFSRLRTVQDGLFAQFSTGSTETIDDISGFSLRLAPLLAQMPHLAQRHHLLTTGEPYILEEISPEAEILEAKISSLLDASVSEKTLSHMGELSSELRSTHLAFVHAALLYLHRRIQSLPRNHFKVRSDITNIIHSCQQIGETSSANILILWPIFTAGCETEIISEREYIQSRMKKMQDLGMGNYTRARESLYTFWASETSLPWDAHFSHIGKEVVLF